GRFSAKRSGVVEVAAGGKIGRTVVPDDDVIQAEGENHVLGDAILRGVTGGPPVGVGAEALVEVTAVIVNQVIATIDDLFGDEEGSAIGLRSIGFAGIEAVHALVINRIDVRDFLFEGSDVDERNQDDRAGNCGGIEIGDQPFDSNDGNVFRAVGAADQSKYRTGLCAIHHDYGNVCCGIHDGGNFEVACSFLARRGRSGADGKRRSLSRGKDWQEHKNEESNGRETK